MVKTINFRTTEKQRRKLAELAQATGADSPSEVLRRLIDHAQIRTVHVVRNEAVAILPANDNDASTIRQDPANVVVSS